MRIHLTFKIIYLNGDFNVNTNPLLKGTPTTQEFKNIMSTNYLYPLITKPTRITEHSATLIDNIYCNISNLAETCKSGILRVAISDHYAIFCINKSVTINNAKQTVTKREFSNKNIAKL